MKRITTYFYLFTLIFSAGTSIGIVRIKRLRQAETPIACKTNPLHTAMTTRGNGFANIADAAGLYFMGKYRPTWQHGMQPTSYDINAQKILFGYDLQIEHIIDHDTTVQTKHTRPTLYFHGLGDNKHSAKLLKAFGDVLPGDVITFNFHDRGVVIPKVRHSNLGQLPDVLPALYTLKWAKDRLKINEIDLFGYSRGGATVLNLIAVLNDKTGKYDKELTRIAIDANERKALLSMIQKGCVTLNCPLTNVNVSAEYRFKGLAPKILKALARVGLYKLDGIQAIESTQTFGDLKLNILLHFQNRDTIVSNKNEAELYKNLAQYNPNSTYIVLGNNGGHLHTHAALAHAIHTFKKTYGSSYDPAYDTQYHATRTLLKDANVLLQPGDRAQQVIENYYARCQKEQAKTTKR